MVCSLGLSAVDALVSGGGEDDVALNCASIVPARNEEVRLSGKNKINSIRIKNIFADCIADFIQFDKQLLF